MKIVKLVVKQMSEQRFTLRTNSVSTNYPSGRIFDNKKQYNLYLDEIVDLLNFQNTQIKCLKEENEQLKKARDESDKFIVKKGLEIEFLEWCMK